jgi:cyclophilin family peptidyl-prolyl cis-trans isomerase
MMRILITLLLLIWCGAGTLLAATQIEMKTSYGTIQIELYPEKAPKTVENFLAYVDRGFYDGTIFHRIISGFMIQGGGFDKSDRRKETAAPIVNEADNGLKNRTGSLAMARTSQVDSATSQFFINLTDNDFLNHRGRSPNAFGYAVFGQVIGGMDVVETIARQRTYKRNNLFQDYPEQQIVIESIRRIDTL